MIADRRKLEIEMANACMNTQDLQKAAGIPRGTLNNLMTGRGVRPRTFGLICRALGVEASKILPDNERGSV